MTAMEMVRDYGAEDPHAFSARVRSIVHDLSLSEGTGLLVSHAGVGRMIQANLSGLPPSGFRQQPLPGNAIPFPIECPRRLGFSSVASMGQSHQWARCRDLGRLRAFHVDKDNSANP